MISNDNQKVYTRDEAFKDTLAYFEGDELPTNVFLDKYALRNKNDELIESNPQQLHKRLAREFSRIENKKFKNPLAEDIIFDYLDHFKKIVAQGSPMSGVGNPYQYTSLSNCYVVNSPLDSYGGIMKTDEQLVQISKRRGGVGLDISNLRPNKTTTTNASRTSTGIIPFMKRYSNTIREVGQSGRRGALMITLNVHHPEVMDFIKCKHDKTTVTGANISVKLTNEFLNAVKNNTSYELRWPVDARENNIEPRFSQLIKARDVWNEIVSYAHSDAEPGILFWDNIIQESPADCYAHLGFRTVSTNPCSEIPLCELDSCRLMLVNLMHCVENPFTADAKFNFDILYETTYITQRLMDDLVDLEIEAIDKIIFKIESDPEPIEIRNSELELWKNIKQIAMNGRRTGTGITALADCMAACGIKYGTEKSIEFTDHVYCTLKLAAYRCSVDMAKELGAFPIWDAELEKFNPFLLRIKNEDGSLYNDMMTYGRRNIALLTTAPAGSVSILTQTTSGIEPLFMMYYVRRQKINSNDSEFKEIHFIDENGDNWHEFKVYHPTLKKWLQLNNETDETKSPWFGCCANDLNWENRVKLQASAQRHIDHAISSTINLPSDASVFQVSQIYKTAWESGCKGITVYRDGCRSGVLLSDKKDNKKEEFTKYVKRPKCLDCDIFHPSVMSKQYFVIVGLLDGKPYELFAGKNGIIDSKYQKAKVTKVRRGVYRLHNIQEVILENISDQVNEEQEAITRLVSMLLRHGNDLSVVVHQLEKVSGNMQSFYRAIARILKKYIPDGSKLFGETCQSCGQENSLVRQEGCVSCKNCGWTKCS